MHLGFGKKSREPDLLKALVALFGKESLKGGVIASFQQPNEQMSRGKETNEISLCSL